MTWIERKMREAAKVGILSKQEANLLMLAVARLHRRDKQLLRDIGGEVMVRCLEHLLEQEEGLK